MWTVTALASEARAAKGLVWRAVEDQHRASTRKLVDTLEEHDLLEALLDADKPPYPLEAEGLHYLLKTPFRYHPPAPHGSRFRRYLVDSGVFYASEQIRTALAEFGYWRLKFFRDAPAAALPRLEERKRWVNPDDYSHTQALADRARQAGIEVIRYESVRDAQHQANVALLTAKAFTGKKPQTQQTWFLYLAPTEINFTRAHTRGAEDRWVFPVTQFA
jgi:hypothetical protein